jgi:hypothetical protein
MLEAGIGASVLASLLVVAVPAFIRNLHASHLVEATEGLARLTKEAEAHAAQRSKTSSGALPTGADGATDTIELLPKSAPLTPAEVPRGVFRLDPPGTWDHPTWQALHFRASAEGEPHAFAFAFDSRGPQSYVATAHGDLDGDGVLSTFEMRGQVGDHPASTLYVRQELE